MKLGASIPDWSEAAHKHGLTDLSQKLAEDLSTKSKGMATLHALKLPHLDSITTTANEFLKNPAALFEKLDAKKYYFTLITGTQRIRAIDLNRDEALDFVNDNITHQSQDITLIAYQYFKNLYSGNIVIDTDGTLYLELAEGQHISLVTGHTTPLAIAKKDPIAKQITFFSYKDGITKELADRNLQAVIADTIKAIPTDTECWTSTDSENYRKIMIPHPGYYEFTLVQKDPTKPNLSPIFLDYRGGESAQKYQLPK